MSVRINVQVSVGNGALGARYKARSAAIRADKKRRKQAKAQASVGVKTWRPGAGYELIQKGEELTAPPHEVWAIGGLMPRHLWHFRSTDPAALRCSQVEGLSKYESVFRVVGMPEGVYAMPIHEQLEQVTRGYDANRLEEILPSGVPYFPDKRLRRLRDEQLHRSGYNDRQKKKKKSARRRVSEKKREMTDMMALNAAVPIDGHISNPVSESTIKTQTKGGTWGTNTVNIAGLPSFAKMNQLRKSFPKILQELGECTPKTREEIIRDLKAARELEEEAAKNKKTRKRGAPRKKKKKTTATATLESEVAPPPPLGTLPAPSAYVYQYEDDEDDEDEEGGVPKPRYDLHVPEDDDEVYAPLAADDELDDALAERVSTQADGTKLAPKYSQSVTAVRAADAMLRDHKKAVQKETAKKRKAEAAAETEKKKPRVLSATDKADLFVDQCFADPNSESVPAEWKTLIEVQGLSKDMKLAAIKASAHYAAVVAFSKASL